LRGVLLRLHCTGYVGLKAEERRAGKRLPKVMEAAGISE
jgi:hypothetical protein